MSNQPKPFLIIQLRPEDDTADSEFAGILRHGGLQKNEVQRLRIEHSGIPELDLERFSAVIVGGSPLDITTPRAQKQPIQLKIESDFNNLFDYIVANDFPFLGACSGNGLLGSYLGVSMSRKYAEPVGATMVTITPEGKSDPLLSGFPDQLKVLLGHKEACDKLPDAATLLVRGDVCPIQMFRVGANVYATQFHPEADPEGFAVRINAYKHHGYFPECEAEQLIRKLRSQTTPRANQILRRFVDRYRQQDVEAV